MDIDSILKSIEQNDALKEKLENMWRNESSSQEIADTLAEFDLKIDAAQAENLLSALQNKQAEELGLEEIDIDELDKVTGGTAEKLQGKCAQYIYNTDCAATVEMNSWCGSNDACIFFNKTYKYATNPVSPKR